MSNKAGFTKFEQKGGVLTEDPLKKKLIERAIKKRVCNMPGSCGQGINPGPSASKK